ncbi:MAG: hypothetical protein AAF447_21295 [Myxococcota bacterium]
MGRALGVIGTALVSLVYALLLSVGATLWLPRGAGGVDHILYPVIMVPLVWLAVLLWLLGTRKRGRAFAMASLLSALSLGAVLANA